VWFKKGGGLSVKRGQSGRGVSIEGKRKGEVLMGEEDQNIHIQNMYMYIYIYIWGY
jgi:hypothetical protein